MKKLVTLTLSTLVLISCGSANNNTTKKTASAKKVTSIIVDPTIYGKTITANELKDMLYIYASDEFEGRETGELGQKKAIEFIKQHYVDMGVASGLSGDDYFQEVPLEKKKSPKIDLSVNGKSFEMFDDFIALTSGENQTLNANDIIYAGFGIDDENYSDYKSIDVKGKIVLIKTGEPKNEDDNYITSGTSEETKWSNGRAAISSKRDVAKEKGAKAVFFMDESLFSRYSGFFKSRAESGGGSLSLKGNSEDILFFMISENLGKAMYADINENNDGKTLATSLNLNLTNTSEEVISENVLAFIKGSEKPNEIIIISAHLDHIGINKDGEINNGADDDGSGTVSVIEIAEAFKAAVKDGNGPKRSILFLHVTGEEKGLLGSRYYADNDPVYPLEDTVVDLNIDMIGRTDPKRDGERNYIYLIGSDKLSTELHTISEEINAKYCNIELDYTYNDENDPNRFYYRSDHYNFAKNNIPVIFYFNGTHADYHKPGDTPDKIEYDLLENRARLVFYTAWELANRDNRIIVDKAN
jgi:Zn-dependent M28 family amino/carboxypeptidase